MKGPCGWEGTECSVCEEDPVTVASGVRRAVGSWLRSLLWASQVLGS